jgi:aspartate dehydrogenase
MKRKPKLKIGVLGCGTIGTYLIKKITTDYSACAQVSFVCDHHETLVKKIKKSQNGKYRIVTLEKLLEKSDLIIEAASPKTVVEIMKMRDAYKKDFLFMSVGGLILNSKLTSTFLEKSEGKIYLPSGAVAGIDGLLAASQAGLKSVLLKTSKPPAGLKNADFFKRRKFPKLSIKNEVCVFQGTAKEAICNFPQNINVAAVLSLAGLGASKTQVQIWTSNQYKVNTHEVSIDSKSGKMSFKIENKPSKNNPKTSALAFYSADAALKRIFSNLHIGT